MQINVGPTSGKFSRDKLYLIEHVALGKTRGLENTSYFLNTLAYCEYVVLGGLEDARTRKHILFFKLFSILGVCCTRRTRGLENTSCFLNTWIYYTRKTRAIEHSSHRSQQPSKSTTVEANNRRSQQPSKSTTVEVNNRRTHEPSMLTNECSPTNAHEPSNSRTHELRNRRTHEPSSSRSFEYSPTLK